MKNSSLEYQLCLYPVIIAVTDFTAETTLFNISVKVYGIISSAILE